jgi:hypothetical protein
VCCCFVCGFVLLLEVFRVRFARCVLSEVEI